MLRIKQIVRLQRSLNVNGWAQNEEKTWKDVLNNITSMTRMHVERKWSTLIKNLLNI